jgi:hypothetical protein
MMPHDPRDPYPILMTLTMLCIGALGIAAVFYALAWRAGIA